MPDKIEEELTKLYLELDYIRNMKENIKMEIDGIKPYNIPKVEDFEETLELTGSGIKMNKPLRKKESLFK